MQLKRGDVIKLLPTWPLGDNPDSPIWGGVHGYHLGHVIKTVTGPHDKAQHYVDVEWGPGRARSFPEVALEKAGIDEQRAAVEFRTGNLPVDDIWVLIRTLTGKFALNIIEAGPFGPQHGCVVGMTKYVMPMENHSDFNIVNMMLSSPDYTDTKCGTIFNAAQHINHLWGLPSPKAVPFPLPEYKTIKEASETAPKDHANPGVLYFQLPTNLVEFAENPALGRPS